MKKKLLPYFFLLVIPLLLFSCQEVPVQEDLLPDSDAPEMTTRGIGGIQGPISTRTGTWEYFYFSGYLPQVAWIEWEGRPDGHHDSSRWGIGCTISFHAPGTKTVKAEVMYMDASSNIFTHTVTVEGNAVPDPGPDTPLTELVGRPVAEVNVFTPYRILEYNQGGPPYSWKMPEGILYYFNSDKSIAYIKFLSEGTYTIKAQRGRGSGSYPYSMTVIADKNQLPAGSPSLPDITMSESPMRAEFLAVNWDVPNREDYNYEWTIPSEYFTYDPVLGNYQVFLRPKGIIGETSCSVHITGKSGNYSRYLTNTVTIAHDEADDIPEGKQRIVVYIFNESGRELNFTLTGSEVNVPQTLLTPPNNDFNEFRFNIDLSNKELLINISPKNGVQLPNNELRITPNVLDGLLSIDINESGFSCVSMGDFSWEI